MSSLSFVSSLEANAKKQYSDQKHHSYTNEPVTSAQATR
jgi:hypothetical protein